jgi:hypothetical protein
VVLQDARGCESGRSPFVIAKIYIQNHIVPLSPLFSALFAVNFLNLDSNVVCCLAEDWDSFVSKLCNFYAWMIVSL